MNAFFTFVLLACAFQGLVVLVFSPERSLRKQLAGQPQEALDAYLRARGMAYGCKALLLIVATCVQTFIIEPGYAIWAILSHVAPLALSYGSLGLSLLTGFLYIFNAARRKRNRVYAPITWRYWVLFAIFALPTAYLWFLFARMIGLL